MLTNQAVTGASGLPVGYGTLVVVYIGVAVGVAWILRRLSQSPLTPTAGQAA
jgi:cytochrome d ubiquinol oxidase subunit I